MLLSTEQDRVFSSTSRDRYMPRIRQGYLFSTREKKSIHCSHSCLFQCFRACIECRTRRYHIIDKDNRRISNITPGYDSVRILRIGEAIRSWKVCLMSRIPHLAKQSPRMKGWVFLWECAGDECCLIETTFQKSGPMNRNSCYDHRCLRCRIGEIAIDERLVERYKYMSVFAESMIFQASDISFESSIVLTSDKDSVEMCWRKFSPIVNRIIKEYTWWFGRDIFFEKKCPHPCEHVSPYQVHGKIVYENSKIQTYSRMFFSKGNISSGWKVSTTFHILLFRVYCDSIIVVLSYMNKNVLLMVSFFLLLILSGVFLLLKNEKPQWSLNHSGSNAEIPTVESIGESYDQSRKEAAKLRKSESERMSTLVWSGLEKDCASLTLQDIREECHDRILIRQIHENATSTGVCTSITHPTRNQECLNTVVFELAMAAENTSMCNTMTGSTLVKERCVATIEEKIYDHRMLSGTIDMKACMWFQDKNIRSVCSKTVAMQDEWVALENAIEGSDIEACNALSQEANRAICTDSVNFRIAMTELDASYCMKIKNSERKDLCESNLIGKRSQSITKSAVSTDNIALCDTLDTTGRNTCRESVFMQRVRATRDPQLCGNFTNLKLINTCKEITAQ